MDERKRMLREINPMLVFVSAGILAVTFLIFSTKGYQIAQICAACPPVMGEQERNLYVLMGIVVVFFAFLSKEKRLLTIREGQEIAIMDAKKAQNRGEIEEEGKIILLEDGRLRYINNKPDVLMVAAGITGDEPVVLVYALDPYSGYIRNISKREYWDSRKDPDLKIVIPPSWIEFLSAKDKYGSMAGLGNTDMY